MTPDDICNLALSKVGTRSTIVNMQEDSPEARQCRIHYDTTRNQVLRMAHWNWAKKTAYLALFKSASGTPTGVAGPWDPEIHPPPPWLYSYSVPSDCIQVRYLVSETGTGFEGVPLFSTDLTVYPYIMGPAVRFEVAADFLDGNPVTVLNTNQFRAIAVYTYRVENTAIYDDLFVEALAAALGAKMVNPLSGERALRKDLFEEANYHIVVARARDGNEGLTVIDTQAEWITARSEVALPGGYWAVPYPPLFSII